jgi:hypothetical protein
MDSQDMMMEVSIMHSEAMDSKGTATIAIVLLLSPRALALRVLQKLHLSAMASTARM